MKKTVHEIDWERVRAELADIIQEAREENTTLVRYNSGTGEAWKVSPDGTTSPAMILRCVAINVTPRAHMYTSPHDIIFSCG
jgi:hypothetical protein